MAAIPFTATGDTLSILFTRQPPKLTACLMANFNSLVTDYCARQIVGGNHVTIGYLRQLPLLVPQNYSSSDIDYISSRVIELTFTSTSLTSFARDLGYTGSPFIWDNDRRAQLRAELDAWYALAYGLNRDELCYILAPQDIKGADYPSESFRVLQEREEKELGEYRTRRLVLVAYDKLIAEGMRPRTEGYS
jgi:hypothetical protein